MDEAMRAAFSAEFLAVQRQSGNQPTVTFKKRRTYQAPAVTALDRGAANDESRIDERAPRVFRVEHSVFHPAPVADAGFGGVNNDELFSRRLSVAETRARLAAAHPEQALAWLLLTPPDSHELGEQEVADRISALLSTEEGVDIHRMHERSHWISSLPLELVPASEAQKASDLEGTDRWSIGRLPPVLGEATADGRYRRVLFHDTPVPGCASNWISRDGVEAGDRTDLDQLRANAWHLESVSVFGLAILSNDKGALAALGYKNAQLDAPVVVLRRNDQPPVTVSACGLALLTGAGAFFAWLRMRLPHFRTRVAGHLEEVTASMNFAIDALRNEDDIVSPRVAPHLFQILQLGAWLDLPHLLALKPAPNVVDPRAIFAVLAEYGHRADTAGRAALQIVESAKRFGYDALPRPGTPSVLTQYALGNLPDAVTNLLVAGLDPEMVDSSGQTPLAQAEAAGAIDALRAMEAFKGYVLSERPVALEQPAVADAGAGPSAMVVLVSQADDERLVPVAEPLDVSLGLPATMAQRQELMALELQVSELEHGGTLDEVEASSKVLIEIAELHRSVAADTRATDGTEDLAASIETMQDVRKAIALLVAARGAAGGVVKPHSADETPPLMVEVQNEGLEQVQVQNRGLEPLDLKPLADSAAWSTALQELQALQHHIGAMISAGDALRTLTDGFNE